MVLLLEPIKESRVIIKMAPSIEVHSDLRISDLYWLFFSNAIWKLTYARWTVAIVLIVLVALAWIIHEFAGEKRKGALKD